jgi:hypothetical protein
MKDNFIHLEHFEREYLNRPPLFLDETFKEKWEYLTPDQKLEYITWAETDKTQTFRRFLTQPGRGEGWDEESITFFEKNPIKINSLKSSEKCASKKAAGSSRRRRRRSIPKSSRKYKKSAKRVFRKKSRSTRRR